MQRVGKKTPHYSFLDAERNAGILLKQTTALSKIFQAKSSFIKLQFYDVIKMLDLE